MHINKFYLILIALLAIISMSLSSCEDDDETEEEVADSVIDYSRPSSGSIKVTGDKSYSLEIKDAGYNISEGYCSICAFFGEGAQNPDGDASDYVSRNNMKIRSINVRFNGNNIYNISADGGEASFNYYYFAKNVWWRDIKRGYFDGDVAFVSYKDKILTVKFTDCKTTIDNKSYSFNGEIQFARRNWSWFEYTY